MSTVLIIGSAWLLLALAALMCVGRAIRAADRMDEEDGRRLGGRRQMANRGAAAAWASLNAADLAALEALYRDSPDRPSDAEPPLDDTA
jgi:hypothetical protein